MHYPPDTGQHWLLSPLANSLKSAWCWPLKSCLFPKQNTRLEEEEYGAEDIWDAFFGLTVIHSNALQNFPRVSKWSFTFKPLTIANSFNRSLLVAWCLQAGEMNRNKEGTSAKHEMTDRNTCTVTESADSPTITLNRHPCGPRGGRRLA